MIRVKLYRPSEDLSDAYAIRNAVFVEEQKFPSSTEIDDYDSIAMHTVVYEDDVPIGTGRIYMANDEKLMLGRICVLSSHRKMGIGDLIVRMLLQFAYDTGADEAYVHSQESAVKFYEKLNFTISGNEDFNEGSRHFPMKTTRDDIASLFSTCKGNR